MEQLERILEFNPNVSIALVNLGTHHMSLGRRQLARELYARAVRVDPGYALAHRYYGQVLTLEGEIEKGLAHLRKALELDPNIQGREDLEYQIGTLEAMLKPTETQPAVSP